MTDARPEPLSLDEVHRREYASINARRYPEKNDKHDSSRPENLVGLSLSGGGIRSSTFCLGVIQALDSVNLISKIDYISTVSGGGYIGSSLVTGLNLNNGENPFIKTTSNQDKNDSRSSEEVKDTEAVGRLRDLSNYLVPNGFFDFLSAAGVIVRGLVANATLVLWVPLLAAGITCLLNPTYRSLTATHPLLANPYLGAPFVITRALLIAGFVLFFIWALMRSLKHTDVLADAIGWPSKVAAWGLVLIATSAFLEAQPLLIERLFDALEPVHGASAQKSGQFAWITALLAPITAIVTFFRQTLKSYLADTSYSSKYSAMIGRFAAKLALWAGALALPLLIWAFYIFLCYWAISDKNGAYNHSPNWLLSLEIFRKTWPIYIIISAIFFGLSYALMPNANSLHHLYRDRLAYAFHFDPKTLEAVRPNLSEMDTGKAPYLLINTAVNLQSSRDANKRGRNADFFLLSPKAIGSVATDYISTSTFDDLAIVGNRVGPMTLASAIAISGAAASSNMGAQTIRPLAPTLAMLNIRLGFWLRNPRHLVDPGGAIKRSTRYKEPVAAPSQSQSAAASAKNPPQTTAGPAPEKSDSVPSKAPSPSRLDRGREQVAKGMVRMRAFSNFFLLAEMFGLMQQYDENVYLTDGGHIENLGIYELLRRRCKIIIAVDAEADPQMRFGSFITLQMYARIDLGCLIQLPMEAIRNATIKAMKGEATIAADITHATDATVPSAPKPVIASPTGPHVAVGRIEYGGGEFGTLIYIKSSLSGDENDYIRDYVRRNPTFPHETTGDQFFSEEQFEVYRALGFHAARRFLIGKDEASVASGEGCVSKSLDPNGTAEDLLARICALTTEPQPQSAPATPIRISRTSKRSPRKPKIAESP